MDIIETEQKSFEKPTIEIPNFYIQFAQVLRPQTSKYFSFYLDI